MLIEFIVVSFIADFGQNSVFDPNFEKYGIENFIICTCFIRCYLHFN